MLSSDVNPDQDNEALPINHPVPVEDQMLHDWAVVGLRRLERHLARRSEFHDFLDRREVEEDNRKVTP